MNAAVLEAMGSLLAALVADGDLSAAERQTGLPGLRSVTQLVAGADGIPVLVVT